MSTILKLPRSARRWWNKPLVVHDGEHLPAELVILRSILRVGEEGAWMNSRGTDSGVIDLVWTADGKGKTVRRDLPGFVSHSLREVYREGGLSRGCPDLVVWASDTHKVRLIEVKCPHWDSPSNNQHDFMRVAAQRGIATEVVEWEFS
jgi:hypothetical protein